MQLFRHNIVRRWIRLQGAPRLAACLVLCLLAAGTMPRLHAQTPELHCIAVHPSGSPLLLTDPMADSLWVNDGVHLRLIAAAPGCGRYVTVSPDGRMAGLKLIDGEGLQTPILIDLQSGNVTRLSLPVRQAGQVSFAADGAVAWTVGTELIIRKNGTDQRIELGSYANLAPLSPDGRFVAFNDERDRIVLLDRVTLQRSVVRDGTGAQGYPLWSPSGRDLCFSGLDGTLSLLTIATGDLWSVGEGVEPAWSPDGTALAFVRRTTDRQRLTGSDLFLAGVADRTITQLTATTDAFECDPVWQRNGELVFRCEGMPDLYRASINDLRAGAPPVPVAMPAMVNARYSSIAARTLATRLMHAAVYFPMPYTNQVYDTPDWYNGHAACGPTSSIMVVAYYGLLPAWNVWCSASSRSPAHWSSFGNYVCDTYMFREYTYGLTANDPSGNPSYGGFGYMWSTGSPHTRMAGYYTNHGLTAVTTDVPGLQQVTDEVTAGFPYTLCNGLTTAGHIIVINGIGDEPHTLIANDPYGNKNSGLYPSFYGAGVRYDWPGYNNGYQNLTEVYWGVTVRPPQKSVVDSIVDDEEYARGFAISNASPASMGLWKDKKAGYNGHMWYTFTRAGDTCSAVWTYHPAATGLFDVSVFIPYSNAQAARYTVTHAQGQSQVVINQKIYRDAWVPLGTFPFTAGGSASVRLGDGSDSLKQAIVFDAVKWSYRGPLADAPKGRGSLPGRIVLEQNYPNPFNPVTTIQYELAEAGPVSLVVYDLFGATVATLVEGRGEAGVHAATWNASAVPSGVYVCRLRSAGAMAVRKLIVLK